MTDDFLTLDRPVPAGGIETVRFFNGRLLSGGDMAREQAAQAARDSLLASAIGPGIAYGFDVAQTAADRAAEGAIITVKPGLAISPNGKLLQLVNAQRLRLARTSTVPATTTNTACVFGTCTDEKGARYAAGEGLYLLVASPVSTAMGRAQVNGLLGDSSSCNVDRDVVSMAFRLLEIRPHLYGGMLQSDPSFRNRVAYQCFGTGVLSDWPANLAARDRRDDDLVQRMFDYGLSKDDVPLALVAFMIDTSAASDILDIRFIDMWAVRRPCTLSDPQSSGRPALASLVAPRRMAAGRAMFEQFQHHLEMLQRQSATFASVTAQSHFPQLPPAGVLTNMDKARALVFFSGMTVRGPVHIDQTSVEPLIRESMVFPAIASSSDHCVWLYRVAHAGMGRTVESTLLFANGHLPYRADARFDLNYWDHANYALIP